MKKNVPFVQQVIYLTDPDEGDTFAYFPYDENGPSCYAQVGGHGACSREMAAKCSIATEEEYRQLHEELTAHYARSYPNLKMNVLNRMSSLEGRLQDNYLHYELIHVYVADLSDSLPEIAKKIQGLLVQGEDCDKGSVTFEDGTFAWWHRYADGGFAILHKDEGRGGYVNLTEEWRQESLAAFRSWVKKLDAAGQALWNEEGELFLELTDVGVQQEAPEDPDTQREAATYAGLSAMPH